MSDKTTWRIRFAALGRAFKARAGDAVTDLAAMSGAGLVAYGAGLIHRPTGFIVLGGLLLVGAFLYSSAKAKP